MIREVCSCGAEFETDHPDQIDLVKSWRRSHKHGDKPVIKDSSTLSNTDIATIGFQPEMPVFNDGEEL